MAESWYLGLSNPSNWGCWVHQNIDGHHDHLVDGTMLLLLVHCPCSGSTCQTFMVSAHKPPQSVYETLDNLFQAFFEEALGCFLRILKSFLLNLTIMILTPPPVLEDKLVHMMVVAITIPYHLNRIKLTVELWKKDAHMPFGVNVNFEHGRLVLEIILVTKETSHATIYVFDGVYWWTFCM